VVGLFIGYGIYHGLVEGNARGYVADLAGPGRRGAAYGLYHATIGFLALPASLIAGWLWQGLGEWPGLGPSAPFLFGALLAGLAAALFLTTLPLSKPREIAP
jgi:MFS family permease